MNLDKAIELNNESEKSLRQHKFIDHADAVKIGNEAINEIKEARDYGLIDISKSLPSETEE